MNVSCNLNPSLPLSLRAKRSNLVALRVGSMKGKQFHTGNTTMGLLRQVPLLHSGRLAKTGRKDGNS